MPGSTHPTSCLSPSPWGHDPWDGAVRGRRGPPTTSLAHKAEKSLGGGQELGELVREWGTERKKQQHVARGPRLPCFLFLDSTTKTPAATASKNRTTAMQGVRTTRAMSRLQEKNFCPRTSRLHPAAGVGAWGHGQRVTAMGKGLAWGARQAGTVVLSLQAAEAGGTLGSASSCCVLSIWRSAAS